MYLLVKSLIYTEFSIYNRILKVFYVVYIINFHVTIYSAEKERILLFLQDSKVVYSVSQDYLLSAFNTNLNLQRSGSVGVSAGYGCKLDFAAIAFYFIYVFK